MHLELRWNTRRSSQRDLSGVLHPASMTSLALRVSATSLLVLAATPRSALADRGALSLDVGVGGTTLALSAPYARGSGSVEGTSFLTSLGLRYALQNWIELATSAYFEPPVTYFHNGVTVTTPDGSFPGTLKHRFYRYSVLVGGRVLTGTIWRFVAGADVGWSHRAYSSFQHINDTDPSNPRDYHLALPDRTQDNLVVAALAGVEWSVGDHWSLSVLPRYEQLLGADSTFAISARLVFSWSWYL
jgi:hypothetical protein